MKLLLFLLSSILILFAISSLALEVEWPSSPMGTNLTDTSTVTILVKYFYEWGIFLGGLAVLISLIIGGFLFLTSAGDPTKLREAKDRIFSAFIGLALLLSSWLILNTINPDLTALVPPSFEKPEVGSAFGKELFEREGRPCEFAMFYKQPYYKGGTMTVKAEENPDIFDLGDNFDPKSVKLFQKCDRYEVCKNGKIYIEKEGRKFETTEECIPPPLFKSLNESYRIYEVRCGTTTELRIPGDVNNDCVVNEEDVNICKENFGATTTNGCEFDKCEWTGDKEVKIDDIFVATRNLGFSCCLKEGGACSIAFYQKGEFSIGGWVIRTFCGDRVANANSSTPNLQITYPSDTPIKCVRVFKTGLEKTFVLPSECEKYNNQLECESASCTWCSRCRGGAVSSLVHPGLNGKCFTPGTDCDYRCIRGECGAECENDFQCAASGEWVCTEECKCVPK